MDEINRTIRMARERKGLTLTQAAELVGISRSTLFRLENGDGRVSMEKLQAVAGGYGYKPGALLDGNLDIIREPDMLVVSEAVRTVLEASEQLAPRPEP